MYIILSPGPYLCWLTPPNPQKNASCKALSRFFDGSQKRVQKLDEVEIQYMNSWYCKFPMISWVPMIANDAGICPSIEWHVIRWRWLRLLHRAYDWLMVTWGWRMRHEKEGTTSHEKEGSRQWSGEVTNCRTNKNIKMDVTIIMSSLLSKEVSIVNFRQYGELKSRWKAERWSKVRRK